MTTFLIIECILTILVSVLLFRSEGARKRAEQKVDVLTAKTRHQDRLYKLVEDDLDAAYGHVRATKTRLLEETDKVCTARALIQELHDAHIDQTGGERTLFARVSRRRTALLEARKFLGLPAQMTTTIEVEKTSPKN